LRKCLILSRKERTQSAADFRASMTSPPVQQIQPAAGPQLGTFGAAPSPQAATSLAPPQQPHSPQSPYPQTQPQFPQAPQQPYPAAQPGQPVPQASKVAEILAKLRNWVIPPNPGRPDGISDEQLRELRAVAVKETKKVKPKDYRYADLFSGIDAGRPSGFSLQALLLSSTWLAYGHIVSKAVILGIIEVLIQFLIFKISPLYYKYTQYIGYVPIMIFAGWVGRRWLWAKTGQIINKAWIDAKGDFDTARFLLHKMTNKKVIDILIAGLLVSIVGVPLYIASIYIGVNTVTCNDEAIKRLAVDIYNKEIAKASNLTIDEFNLEYSSFIQVYRETDRKSQYTCACEAEITVTRLSDNKQILSHNVDFIATTEGTKLGDVYVELVINQ
jgi:hypothetical protein